MMHAARSIASEGQTQAAGFWPRLAAFILDYLVVALYIVILTVALRPIISSQSFQPFGQWIFSSPARWDLFAFLILVLPVTLYFALSECSRRQATWGKQRMKLRVVDTTGQRLSLPRSLIRSGLKFLPWQIAHTSLFAIPGWPLAVQSIPPGSIIGFALVWLLGAVYLVGLALPPAHHTLYDRLAGSQVIRKPQDEPPRA